MFDEESLWIKEKLKSLPISSGATVLDVGSSTREYREVLQPYVERNVFSILRKRGLEIYHADAKEDEGVDIVCNVTDETTDLLEQIGRTFDLVICSNLLAYVTNLSVTMTNILKLVGPGGYLLVTTPLAYRTTLDPVDNMFRPSPQQLVEMLCEKDDTLEPIASEVVRITAKKRYKKQSSKYPLWGYREYIRYYLKPLNWKSSCVLLKKQPIN